MVKEKNKKKKIVTKKRINKKKEKDMTSKILLGIFLCLCVVVFVLATIMITENASNRKNKYDIQVPITEEELTSPIDIKINMEEVEKNQSKEYRIQAVNYVDDKINDKIITYQIKVTPSKNSKIDIELYSNKDNFELLDGKKKITGQRLSKNKKEKIIYTLKLTQRQQPKKDEYVAVEIAKDE